MLVLVLLCSSSALQTSVLQSWSEHVTQNPRDCNTEMIPFITRSSGLFCSFFFHAFFFFFPLEKPKVYNNIFASSTLTSRILLLQSHIPSQCSPVRGGSTTTLPVYLLHSSACNQAENVTFSPFPLMRHCKDPPAQAVVALRSLPHQTIP